MTPEAPAESALGELCAVISAEGGLLADALRSDPGDLDGLDVFGELLAEGERTRQDPRGYAVLIESILEGYLLHHSAGRITEQSDPDLRLLAGDYLYAFGLARLASIGDLDAVEELADLISLCAQAHAPAVRGEAAEPWPLTGGLWALAALAIANGSWPEQRRAKELSREQQVTPTPEQVLDAARGHARSLGVASELERALIAFHDAVEGSLSTK
jgi:hypothetical protein